MVQHPGEAWAWASLSFFLRPKQWSVEEDQQRSPLGTTLASLHSAQLQPPALSWTPRELTLVSCL